MYFIHVQAYHLPSLSHQVWKSLCYYPTFDSANHHTNVWAQLIRGCLLGYVIHFMSIFLRIYQTIFFTAKNKLVILSCPSLLNPPVFSTCTKLTWWTLHRSGSPLPLIWRTGSPRWWSSSSVHSLLLEMKMKDTKAAVDYNDEVLMTS